MFVDVLGADFWVPKIETPCAQQPDFFADPPAGRAFRNARTLAQQLCFDECPVQDECLETAMAGEINARRAAERHGIRGGLLPRDRHKLQKNRNDKSERAQKGGYEEAEAGSGSEEAREVYSG